MNVSVNKLQIYSESICVNGGYQTETDGNQRRTTDDAHLLVRFSNEAGF